MLTYTIHFWLILIFFIAEVDALDNGEDNQNHIPENFAVTLFLCFGCCHRIHLTLFS